MKATYPFSEATDLFNSRPPCTYWNGQPRPIPIGQEDIRNVERRESAGPKRRDED